MSPNRYTRGYILDRAGELASKVGLNGLTIGTLAHHIRRPKSTVFSHFHPKLRLQLDVLEHAARDFAREVIAPASQAPEGLPRVRRLFEEWLTWARRGTYPGGCPFVAMATELDDRPGQLRDRLVRLFRVWQFLLRRQVLAAMAAGALPPTTDPDQFAHDLHGIMLAFHHSARLIKDPEAERRARLALVMLLGRR